MGGGGGSSSSAASTSNVTNQVTKSVSDSYNKTTNKVRNINRTGGTRIYVSGKNAAGQVPALLAAAKGGTAMTLPSGGSDWPSYVMMLAALVTVYILLRRKAA